VPSCLFDGYFGVTLDVVLVFQKAKCALKYVMTTFCDARRHNLQLPSPNMGCTNSHTTPFIMPESLGPLKGNLVMLLTPAAFNMSAICISE
jgi:hypothetical protein